MITTSGRIGSEDFFKLSGILDWEKLSHTPILVFVESGNDITVEIGRNAREVSQSYPPVTKCMAQWKGQWSSDFFQFTVGDIIQALELKESK